MHTEATTYTNKKDMRIRSADNCLGQDLYHTQVDGRGACCVMTDVTIIAISHMRAASGAPGR